MIAKLSTIAHEIAPPFIWKWYLRLRDFRQENPWREFQSMATRSNVAPLLKGRFSEIFDRYCSLDPFVRPDTLRYGSYNYCLFGNLCREVAGDFLFAGVSWGVMPRVLFDFVDLPTLAKTLHLVDPFEGTLDKDSRKISSRYNSDPEFVRRQYPPGSVIMHRKTIPCEPPAKLAFVGTNTGDPESAARSIPIFFEALSPGGMIMSFEYSNEPDRFDEIFDRLGVIPLWMPSGQGVIRKPI